MGNLAILISVIDDCHWRLPLRYEEKPRIAPIIRCVRESAFAARHLDHVGAKGILLGTSFLGHWILDEANRTLPATVHFIVTILTDAALTMPSSPANGHDLRAHVRACVRVHVCVSAHVRLRARVRV